MQHKSYAKLYHCGNIQVYGDIPPSNEFISNSQTFRENASDFGENDIARTVYIGDGGSNISYRFYDKDKKTAQDYGKTLEEIGTWKRTELQLRNEKAHEFAQLMAKETDSLGQQIFNLLGTNLRFVVPNKNESNKSRWKTCRFWERFLGTVKPLKITIAKAESNLYATEKWLREGGALAAIKAFQFLEENHALGGLRKA